MKLKINRIIFILLIGMLSLFGLASCSKSASSPKDVIKDYYGDKEFKISFSDSNLNESLSDVIYTANNIPKLPTPTKVGYRFSGWYFDQAYTSPYDSDYLYTKMCDLTLYAKWEKEEFINNGIYEIGYECNIIDDSITKGNLADKYGYLEFPDLINPSETYIEKNDNGTFLRIQYDMKYHCPTIDDDGNLGTLTITVSDIDNRVSDSKSIIDRTGTTETVYYDISGLNIADPITLTIDFYNWDAKLQPDESRENCSVGYKVKFKITNFVGYTTSYVDSHAQLEDGYYLVKTHYASLSKGASMLDTFNPVYSYIIAKNGNYQLVKPMNSYNSDILGNLNNDDYIDYKTGFSRDIAYFTFDNSLVATDQMMEDYETTDWAKFFNAEKFGDFTYEFNASTGKYYYVFDLGTSCDKDLFLVGASSGAMTEMFNMGPSYKRLVIDYSSMVRLSSIDYEPLTGTTYSTFNNQSYYFLTDLSSLKGNTIYDAENDYDTANRMLNFFYSSTNSSKVSKLHSSKMTISFNNSKTIQESKGSVFTFNATLECYDYDVLTDKFLYGDYLDWQTYSTYAQRERKQIELGYLVNTNDLVDLRQVYLSKIYQTIDEKSFTYSAYQLNSSGNADFSKPITLDLSNYTFKFSNDVAVILSSEVNGDVKYGLVYIRGKEEPNIKIVDRYRNDKNELIEANWTYDSNSGYYVSSKSYFKGDTVHFPEIRYTSYGNQYTSLDAYDSQSKNYHMNQEDISIYTLTQGIYKKVNYDYTTWNDSLFEMTADYMVVLYHLTDRYNNKYNLLFMYKGNDKGTYTVTKDDVTVASGSLNYTTGGVRNAIKIIDNEAFALDDIAEPFNTIIDLNIGSYIQNMPLTSFVCYTRESTVKGSTLDELSAALEDAKYALIDFTYSNGNDSYTISYVYNLKINGKNYSSFNITSDECWYVNNRYVISSATLMDDDGTRISESTLTILKYNGNYYSQASESDYAYTTNNYTFLKGGKYKVYYQFTFAEDENEEYALKDYNAGTIYSVKYRTITISKYIEVYELDKEISLTYVTDAAHPFRSDLAGVVTNDDGSYSYTVSVKQSDKNYALSSDYFESSSDKLYKWAYKKKNGKLVEYVSQGALLNYVGVKESTTSPILYAIWDEGVTVTANYKVGGVTYEIATIRYYKSGSNYVLDLADFIFTVPSGCTFEGWKSNKVTFYTGTYPNTVYSDTTTNTFDGTFNINESCVLTAIIKESLTLKFFKYNENDTLSKDNLEALTKLPTQKVLEDHTIASQLQNNVINSIKRNSPANTKYYAIYYNGELIKIDFDTTLITSDYIVDGIIYIVAVYEE